MDKNIGVMLDGRYEIKKRIGVGGMADVYRAYDRSEGRDVAVKILKNEYTKNDEFLQRFKNFAHGKRRVVAVQKIQIDRVYAQKIQTALYVRI